MKTFIYVMDPQCGWCFAASENVSKIYEEYQESFAFDVYVGGMWLGEKAPKGSKQMREFVEGHSSTMQSVAKTAPSVKHFELTEDASYTFSSLEPSAAITLIKSLDKRKVFPFIKAMQDAFFKEAKRLDKIETYLEILKTLEIEQTDFTKQWLSDANIKATYGEFEQARTLAQGFPSFILEDNGSKRLLASGYFEYDAMKKTLQETSL